MSRPHSQRRNIKPKRWECSHCNGLGHRKGVPDHLCPKCGGKGYIEASTEE